jgi:hypothetical protein
MPNSHGIGDSNRWYSVNGDTWTHGECRSPNQICKPNPQLDFHGNWHGVYGDNQRLLDLHEHGDDTVGPMIVSSTTGQGL